MAISKAEEKRRAKRQETFCKFLAEGATVAKAAKAIKAARSVVYQWREQDEAFAAAWADAYEIGTDALEDEAWRRAVEGIEKPVGFYQGEPSAFVKEYDTTLLIFLLKGRRPEKFAETKRVHMTGNVEHKHSHNYDFSKLSNEQVDQLESLLEAAEPDPDQAGAGEEAPGTVH